MIHAKVDGRLVIFQNNTWKYKDTGLPVEDFQNDGTLCENCGRTYFFNLIIPHHLWEKVKPLGKPQGGGMLCPQCIVSKIEKHMGTCVFYLTKDHTCNNKVNNGIRT